MILDSDSPALEHVQSRLHSTSGHAASVIPEDAYNFRTWDPSTVKVLRTLCLEFLEYQLCQRIM